MSTEVLVGGALIIGFVAATGMWGLAGRILKGRKSEPKA